MAVDYKGLMWLLLLLGPLLISQRKLHQEIQSIFLLITRRPDISMVLFAVLFLPGVVLHEASHFLMARLLMVRTGRFSILPRILDDGKVQLGYVETEKTDWLRDALIGMAPLLTGGIFVAYAGIQKLGLVKLWGALSAGDMTSLYGYLQAILAQPDFWLWFYLMLTVSSTMMPSASDRRAWLPLGLFAASLLVLSLMAGAGPWMLANLAGPFDQVLQAVAIVFGISLLAHIVFLIPLWGLRIFISWMMGVRIEPTA